MGDFIYCIHRFNELLVNNPLLERTLLFNKIAGIGDFDCIFLQKLVFFLFSFGKTHF
jgi:hypothetical protein